MWLHKSHKSYFTNVMAIFTQLVFLSFLSPGFSFRVHTKSPYIPSRLAANLYKGHCGQVILLRTDIGAGYHVHGRTWMRSAWDICVDVCLHSRSWCLQMSSYFWQCSVVLVNICSYEISFLCVVCKHFHLGLLLLITVFASWCKCFCCLCWIALTVSSSKAWSFLIFGPTLFCPL